MELLLKLNQVDLLVAHLQKVWLLVAKLFSSLEPLPKLPILPSLQLSWCLLNLDLLPLIFGFFVFLLFVLFLKLFLLRLKNFCLLSLKYFLLLSLFQFYHTFAMFLEFL